MKNGTYSFCNYSNCPWLKQYEADKESDSHNIVNVKDELDAENMFLEAEAAFDPTCNLYCDSCRKQVKVCEFDEKQRKIIDYFASHIFPYCDCVRIAGNGEVFISKQYRELIDRIDYIPTIKILSNANYVDYELLDDIRKKCNFLTISVSVDAASSEIYEIIRRGGNFKTVKKNLVKFGKMRAEGYFSYFSISFVLQKKNMYDLEKFIELGKDVGADSINIIAMHRWDSVFSEEKFEEFSLFDGNQVVKPEYKDYLDMDCLNDEKVFCSWKKNSLRFEDYEIEIMPD